MMTMANDMTKMDGAPQVRMLLYGGMIFLAIKYPEWQVTPAILSFRINLTMKSPPMY